MKSPLRIALACAAAAVAAFAAPASASAGTTYCVHSPASCPAGAMNETAVQDAVDASNTAGGSSTILVGPGTFADGFTNITGQSSIAIVGAGAGQTRLTSTSDTLDDSSSSVSGVTIVVPDSMNAIGLTLTAGTVSDSAITDAGDSSTSLDGVELNGPATLSHSSITLADSNARGIFDFGATSGVATVADTTIDATADNGTGVEGGSAAETDLLRDRIIAAVPVSLDGGGAITRIDDSLIEGTQTGSFYSIQDQTGAAGTTTTLLIDHDTLNGAGGAVAPGIAAVAGSPTGAALAVMVRNTIIESGNFTNLDVSPPSMTESPATLSISYSDYDSAEQYGPGTITAGPGNVNVAPGFVGSGADPFALTSSSPLLDKGDPAGVESGETSTTDLLGAPRVHAAGVSCTAHTDIGAYEFDPTTIATTAKPAAASVAAGKPVGFSASPCDPDPKQPLTVTWSFDDEGTASGTSVTHTFKTPGRHTATVHVIDPAGRSGTATASITVTGSPPCSGASCKPRAPVLRLHGGTVHLSRQRKALLGLTCIAVAPCRGTLTLRAVITRVEHHTRKRVTLTLATVRFTIRAGATATLKLTISRANAALITKLHKLTATATILAHDGSSANTRKTARVTLKPPKPRPHR